MLVGVGATVLLVTGCGATGSPVASPSPSSSASSDRLGSASGPGAQQAFAHEGVCLQPPAAYVTVPGQAERPMRTGHSAGGTGLTLMAVVSVGDPIQVRFFGSCIGGTRLVVTQSSPGTATAATWHIVSTGGQVQSWAPPSAGTWTVDLEWGCSGPVRCPLDELGRVAVTALPTAGPHR